MSTKVSLKRTISLTQLVLYGLGTIIGAGIYALVGEMAAIAGYFSPISFLVASLIATLTAMSFAELSSRFPRAAGTAIYVREGFGSVKASTITGILVTFAGMVSAAALINGFVGYLHQFVQIEAWIAIIIVTLVLGLIAAWGINESVTVAGIISLIEVGGLILIIMVSQPALSQLPEQWPRLIPDFSLDHWHGIFLGTILAFYAFIGFEDMVVVAEEVHEVKRNMPLAILITVAITTLLYMLIMVTAILAMPPAELAGSDAPMSTLYQHFTGNDATLISLIGLVAIINGALIQMIMASRILYGLSCQGQLPAVLSYVSPKTRTPLATTLIAFIIILSLALIGHLSILAEICSVIMLIIFSLVNLSLIMVKKRQQKPADAIVFPLWIPLTGFLMSTGFVFIILYNYLT